MRNISPTAIKSVPTKLILKQGDDLRQDMITLKMFSLFEKVILDLVCMSVILYLDHLCSYGRRMDYPICVLYHMVVWLPTPKPVSLRLSRVTIAEVMTVRLVIREHGSVSLCRDGQKTKWRLQCKY